MGEGSSNILSLYYPYNIQPTWHNARHLSSHGNSRALLPSRRQYKFLSRSNIICFSTTVPPSPGASFPPCLAWEFPGGSAQALTNTEQLENAFPRQAPVLQSVFLA